MIELVPSVRTNCQFILISNLNDNNVQIIADKYVLDNKT